MSADPLYLLTGIGIYVGAAIGVLFGSLVRIGRIEESGEAFESEYAEHVHALQLKAFSDGLSRLAGEYPALRKLLVEPPQPPKDEADEEHLRADLDSALVEVTKMGGGLQAFSKPDVLYQSIVKGYEQKATTLGRLVVLTILIAGAVVSLVALNLVLSAGLVLPINAASILGFAVLAGMELEYATRLQSISEELKTNRAGFVEEVNRVVNRHRRFESEIPPSEGPADVGGDPPRAGR